MQRMQVLFTVQMQDVGGLTWQAECVVAREIFRAKQREAHLLASSWN